MLVVICNLETDFIVSRGTNGQYNLQTVLHKQCFLGANLDACSICDLENLPPK